MTIQVVFKPTEVYIPVRTADEQYAYEEQWAHRMDEIGV